MNTHFTFFHRNGDYLMLVVAALILFGALHRWLWRKSPSSKIPLVTWVIVALTLAGGWFLVQEWANVTKERMEKMVAGYAPTYAQELALMGHQEITPKTSPDDPRYWRMISAEKRWLAANPSISDIYTLRKLTDGRIAFIVDSETDYNHDGKYEGEREQRTKIGEIYESELTPYVLKALAGEAVFVKEPYTDRWGTWVSAVVPMRDFRGDVEAALGVDFDARSWVAAVRRSRLTSICCLMIFLLVVAGGSGVLAHQNATRELHLRIDNQEWHRVEKLKLETLINSIDGIVWEADARTFEFSFVSQQSEAILGYTPKEWTSQKDFWKSKLHPEDQWAHDYCARMVAEKVPYCYDYRMIAADGRTVWIRENAAVMLDKTGKPLLVRGVFYDISAQKKATAELEQANAKLVDSSRFAGMAEVATGVLHNVGNVLNSVNISGSMISERLRKSKVIELGKVAGLLTLQKADFVGFVTRDPRGPHIPELISAVADALREEHADLLEEVDAITRNIGHIKEIVSMQQGFAKGDGIIEALNIQTLVDDALKINSVSLTRHRITVVQAYEEVPPVSVDKHLILQILVNLLRNAKQAIETSGIEPRRIVVRIQSKGPDFVRVAVQDSGSGIAPENLTRIFSHGFTTKKNGHGFGLHSAALAAKNMGGSLHAHSDGLGTGATFILELPVYQPALTAVAA